MKVWADSSRLRASVKSSVRGPRCRAGRDRRATAVVAGGRAAKRSGEVSRQNPRTSANLAGFVAARVGRAAPRLALCHGVGNMIRFVHLMRQHSRSRRSAREENNSEDGTEVARKRLKRHSPSISGGRSRAADNVDQTWGQDLNDLT